MNVDFEAYAADSYTREVLIAEALIQNIKTGVYVDISDVKKELRHEHWKNVVFDYALKYDMK